MTMCFDCKYQNIQETSHEWVECFCKVDGCKHNPYRPMVFFDKDCPNWAEEENNDKEQN